MQPDELQIATYKGVEWLVTEGPTSGGKKTVAKRPLNSDRQTIEELGRQPREYTLNGQVSARYNPDGSIRVPYRVQRRRLIDAFESEGPGVLIHPFLGRMENLVALRFRIGETSTSLGMAPLEVTFAPDDGSSLPRVDESVVGSITEASEAVLTSVDADIADRFEVEAQQQGVFEDALDRVQSAAQAYRSAIRRVALIGEPVVEVLDQVDELEEEATAFALDPIALADRIVTIARDIEASFDDKPLAYRTFVRLFGFGDELGRLAENTLARITRQRNRDAINGGVQAGALAGAYLAAAERDDYETTDDLLTVELELEAQYDKIRDQGTAPGEILDALADLRVATLRFFAQQRDVRPRIIEIETPLVSVRVLAFRYYGATDQADVIARLNDSPDGLVEGRVRILSP